MTDHVAHGNPARRDAFLVDGCPRCREYVDDLGVHFDPIRFREFWEHMTRVEWDNADHYRSEYDKELGRKLYLVSLSFERAFGLQPRVISVPVLSQLRDGLGIEVTDPRD